jgi:hypothetical protein
MVWTHPLSQPAAVRWPLMCGSALTSRTPLRAVSSQTQALPQRELGKQGTPQGGLLPASSVINDTELFTYESSFTNPAQNHPFGWSEGGCSFKDRTRGPCHDGSPVVRSQKLPCARPANKRAAALLFIREHGTVGWVYSLEIWRHKKPR